MNSTEKLLCPTLTTRCSATFRVLHNDRIGALPLPAGPYRVSINKGNAT